MTDIFHCRYDPKNQMVHGFFFMSSALFRWLFKSLHLKNLIKFWNAKKENRKVINLWRIFLLDIHRQSLIDLFKTWIKQKIWINMLYYYFIIILLMARTCVLFSNSQSRVRNKNRGTFISFWKIFDAKNIKNDHSAQRCVLPVSFPVDLLLWQ